MMPNLCQVVVKSARRQLFEKMAASSSNGCPPAASSDHNGGAADDEPPAVDPEVFAANGDAKKGLCKELNESHPSLVLGLASRLWPGAREAKVTALHGDKLVLAATGWSPIREELVMPLAPPVASAAEAKARLLAGRESALAPMPDRCLAGALAGLMVPLFGAAYTDWRAFGFMRAMAAAVFGRHAALGLDLLARFTITVHAVEAGYAFHLARSTLRLRAATVAGWVSLTFAFGAGGLNRLRRLTFARAMRGMDRSALVFRAAEA